jgi:hypothetical protein
LPVTEVDLRDLPGIGLHRDRDVLGLDASRTMNRAAEPLHGRVRSAKVGVLQPQTIEDRARPHAFRDHPFDHVAILGE